MRWRRHRRGSGHVVLIEGPAGLGKTSLLRGPRWPRPRTRASRACARGPPSSSATSPTAASGSCSSPRSRRRPRPSATAVRRRRGALEAAVRPDRRSGGAAVRRSARSRCCTASTGWSTTSPTSARSSLAVDDIHWSDAESLRFFNYLAPRLDGLPLAVLAIHPQRRGHDAGSGPAGRRPPRRPCCGRGRSAPGATATLCERRLGTEVAPEFAAACREATGGNPFFLEALLREVSERRICARRRRGPASRGHRARGRRRGGAAAALRAARRGDALGPRRRRARRRRQPRRGRVAGRAAGGRGRARRRPAGDARDR